MARQQEEKKNQLVSTVTDFTQDSIRFIQKCTKPDRKEYTKILTACAIGFGVMGVIGYLVKLVFIPINNILLGSNI